MSQNSTTSDNLILTPTTLYGYVPTEWICVTFLILFSITTVIHVGEALLFKPRLYWLLPTTAMCGLGEILGWSARLWSSKNPVSRNAFLMQVTTTIISPVFLTAALYTILGLVIERIGFQYSRLHPKKYLKIFLTADIVALLVQASGGGLASSNKTSTSNLGSHIMLLGIFSQMGGMLCYTYLAGEFLFRVRFQKPFVKHEMVTSPPDPSNDKFWKSAILDGNPCLPPRMILVVLGLALSTFFVFIRTFYRTVELVGGWRGPIIRTQVYFNLFDGVPIFLALFVLNILSPAFLLRAKTQE